MYAFQTSSAISNSVSDPEINKLEWVAGCIVLCVGVSKAPPVPFVFIQNHAHVSVLYSTLYRTVVV